ncbi:MerR family transcriptional regulator, glutamine synthetase repressor [Sulfobacillus thermosulfidooxidans DSM 9293]|uniref:MerR family transcriptional regulator, glutamine synthetase repressor n=2 Tax=Sulfobacillus thermosulfidooxidans TaxID=28034 RepID=A0A1W1WGQ5_SULTA|nr:MerR family transcriptional regulator [Sulfobacillus thermosulfidooxidans]PSR28211.1 MAG: MerR family transcriptional regulator [Sulfobacillus thermosulfidooxidans]SMC05481.1 MerR family transcriptional regulator, glutamine synthetase repressor [Sulfobacillus thermosulfidooxidans DSM 9293]
MKNANHSDQPSFSIRVVKEATGLTERRIRYYETLHLLAPRRTQGNQRLYTQADIDRLKYIKSLLDHGVSLKEVRAQLQQEDLIAHDRDFDDVERDAESYFQGKLIARKAEIHRDSLYPLINRHEIMRRLVRDHTSGHEDTKGDQ